jgi:hypothetical protein
MILELYGGNIFMAEMDYPAMGLDAGQWIMLVKEAYDAKLITPTLMMMMADRASVS